MKYIQIGMLFMETHITRVYIYIHIFIAKDKSCLLICMWLEISPMNNSYWIFKLWFESSCRRRRHRFVLKEQ